MTPQGSWGALVVRPHGGPGVGSGHLMRTLALVERVVGAGEEAVVAVHTVSDALAARVEGAGGRVHRLAAELGTHHDAAETAGLASTVGASWIVVDGAPFGADYQAAVRGAGHRVLVIDDHGRHVSYDADIVIDQNLGAERSRYVDRPTGSRLLLGARYALLRREFTELGRRPDPTTPVEHLVIALGGDPSDHVSRFGDALHDRLAASFPDVQILFRRGGDDLKTSWGDFLARVDIAVSAAGTTAWELCHLGVPSVLLAVADDQEPVGAAVAAAGAARWVGRLGPSTVDDVVVQVQTLVGDADARRVLSGAGRDLVDGRGAARVLAAMRAPLLDLRPASEADARRLWSWANDPGVRAASFGQEPIAWEDHVLWLKRRLADPGGHLFIAHDPAGEAVAQVRFEPQGGGDVEIGLSVARDARGRGIAAPLILAGATLVFALSDTERIHGWMRPENVASAAAFEAAGFTLVGEGERGGGVASHGVLERRDLA